MQVRLLTLDLVLRNPSAMQSDKTVNQKIWRGNESERTNNKLKHYYYT